MRAVVLVGGRGTRLQPLTDTRPKPILPIVDVPFLQLQLTALAERGVSDVTLACGFKPDEIERVLGDGAAIGITLRYAIEPAPLDTGGAIAFAARAAMSGELGPPPQAEGPWVVCNGDVLGPPNLDRLLHLHRERGAVATIALTPVEDPTRYGLVRTTSDGAVTAFVEKPPIEECDTNLINAGTYLLEDAVFDLIPPGVRMNVEREVYPQLVGRGLFAFGSDDYWLDIGTIPTYVQGNLDVLAGRVSASSTAIDAVRASADGVAVDPTATVAADASITGPCWIGPGAVVESGARIDGGFVSQRALVRAGASLQDSIVLEEAVIDAGALLQRSVVAEGTRVAAGLRTEAGTVVGPDGPVSVA